MPMPKPKIKWCKRSSWGLRKFRKMSSPCDVALGAGKEQKMFRLLLSSYGFNTPIMREKYAKVIPQGDDLYEKKCLIVPYAGFDVEKTFQREQQGLVEFGFNPDKIGIIGEHGDVSFQLPDYIYVPGGDPFKLLRSIRENGVVQDIVEYVCDKGAVYIGVSAGADIATENIEYVTQLEDNNVIDEKQFEALGLITESVLCHYDHYSYSTLKACREISGRSIVTINDDQLLMFEDGKWRYIGEEE